MASSTCFLLKSGTVLLHQENDQVVAKRSDILVRDKHIVAIAENIPISSDITEILDCTSLLISPGLTDTHHHLWQTALKGRHSNDLLSDYIPRGFLVGFFYNTEDVRIGELGGALECIDAGTTTVVDHMHVAYSTAHIDAALEGLESSGVRAVFCPAPTVRVKQMTPEMQVEEKVLPGWFMDSVEGIAKRSPLGNGRISLGLAFDSFTEPRAVVEGVFERARKSGVKLITSHHFHGEISFDAVTPLSEYDLMGKDILLSHCNGITEDETTSVLSAGAHISSSPTTELQMGLGSPASFHEQLTNISSLGVDCHSATSSSIIEQARLALQYTRGVHNQHSLDTKTPLSMKATTMQAFNLATIQGARAIGMADKIGSIAVGKFADLVFWDMKTPGMIAATEQDPVAAIVMHSSIGDVWGVMVDGVFRKRDGKLLSVEGAGGRKMEWSDVAGEVVRSRVRIEDGISQGRGALRG